MKAVSCQYFLLFLLFLAGKVSAQKVETIKIRKEPNVIFFFQKGAKKDTISDHSLFYLLIPDSLKKNISIYVDNGQFTSTANDSLVCLNYRSGLKYESLYERGELHKNNDVQQGKTKTPSFEFKTLINGAFPDRPNTIFIRIVNKQEDRILLENTYYLESK